MADTNHRDVDESGWRDINERLADCSHQASDIDRLVDHTADRLVSHFGVDVVEIWLGKEGARHHAMREIAAAAVAHLVPVLDTIEPGEVAKLITSGDIGAPMPPPWDDHWRTQRRTAGWRS